MPGRRTIWVEQRITRALAAAGAKLLVGTDSGNPYVVAGASLHDEIDLLVATGIPRPAVLRAATAGAAEYFDKLGQAGVVAPGARADLIVADTNARRRDRAPARRDRARRSLLRTY